ncbi:hypothetical protein Pan216_05980 [Planctomycetes bacterium Pan216]|uniref:Uncharacterized protein n=1 Tax=Kolteria novifilia TaxID=2527975 RepID=A0A518AYG4_9BACT|nr:hypothetical protein Pan216_05980 [Planctomycetes bacterium Pan216]
MIPTIGNRTWILSALLLGLLGPSPAHAQYYGYGYNNYGYGGYGYGGWQSPLNNSANWGLRASAELQAEAAARSDNIRAYSQSELQASQTQLTRAQARRLAIENRYQAERDKLQLAQMKSQLAKQQTDAAQVRTRAIQAPSSTTATNAAAGATRGTTGSTVSVVPTKAFHEASSSYVKSFGGNKVNWPKALMGEAFAKDRTKIDALVAMHDESNAKQRNEIRSQLRLELAELSYDLHKNHDAMSSAEYLSAQQFLKRMTLATW